MKKQKSLIIIIIIIMISMIPFYKVKAETLKTDNYNNKTIYYYCNGRNITTTTNNDGYFSTSCTNSVYDRFLKEWYMTPNTPGRYYVKIPFDVNVLVPNFDDSQYKMKPTIKVINTDNNWETIYSGTCSIDDSYTAECEFTTNKNFNYISASVEIRIANTSGVFVSGNLGTSQLWKITTNEDIEIAIQAIQDADLDSTDKNPADTSAYDSTNQTEKDIYDTLFNNAPNPEDVIDFTIDTQSNGWIWNTMTNLIQTNQRIIGLFVTILSIGVAKLIMSR